MNKKVKKIFVDYIADLSYNIFAAFDKAALVGEPAVPCNLQSATAGVMPIRGLSPVELPSISGVDVWVLRNRNL